MAKSDSQNALDALLGRALRDKDFRQKLLDDPKTAARDSGLSEQEIEMVAGGLSIGNSLINPGSIMYCTEKTCNEKGGARVIMWSPDESFNPNVVISEVAKAKG